MIPSSTEGLKVKKNLATGWFVYSRPCAAHVNTAYVPEMDA